MRKRSVKIDSVTDACIISVALHNHCITMEDQYRAYARECVKKGDMDNANKAWKHASNVAECLRKMRPRLQECIDGRREQTVPHYSCY
jgi:hypothetical protein